MRTQNFLPGIIIILLGVLFLLGNLSVFSIDWNFLGRLWPVLIILIGILMIGRAQKSMALFVVALLILAGAGIAAAVRSGNLDIEWPTIAKKNSEQIDRTFSEEYDIVGARAKFRLEAGAGSFEVGGATSELITVDTSATQGKFRLDRTEKDGITDLLLSQEGSFSNFSFGKLNNSAKVRLNDNPIWDIDLKTGAASTEADLSAYKVDTLTIDAGASSVAVKLGDKQQELRGTITAGAASLTVRIPDNVGCEILTDTGLSSRDFEGFIKDGSTYRTSNFESSQKRIFLTIKTGAASIKVERY